MITVVETATYLARASKLLTEEERMAVVSEVAARPDSGAIIPDTGGLRKLRFGLDGRGKRGGARVIYLFLDLDMPVLLLLAYAKNERDDMTPAQKAGLAKMVTELKRRRRQ